MPGNGTDEGDEAEEPSNYHEYQIAKNERAAPPDRERPRTPAHGFEGVGGGFDPSTLDFGPDTEGVAKEGNPVIEALPDDEAEGSSEQCAGPTTEAMLREAADGAHEGREALLERVRDLDPVDDVDWQAELADQQASEKEVLLEIRDQLKEMEQPAAQAETVAKALEQAAEDNEAEDGPDSPGERLQEQLDDLSAMLEARMDGEAEDDGQGGARKGEAVEKSDSRIGQLTRESWRELADCLSGEAREACPVK
jgi:hypothetical protein